MDSSGRSTKVRFIFHAAVVAIAGLVVGNGSPAGASWCAVYQVGGTNCGFSTQQTCQATVSGVGGFCNFIPDGSDRRDRQRVERERPERKKQEADSDQKSRSRESQPAKRVLAPGPGLV